MSLSIIIVNYKTPQLLLNCLCTIYDQSLKINFELIIVDNHSEDNSKEIITSAFPEVKWITLGYNSGFARANNEGICQSSGDIVLLLNSDTLNIDNAIENCYLSFYNSKYVACGVQLLNPDRTPQISGNYFMKGGLNNLLPLPYVGQFIKWLGHLFSVEKPHVLDTTDTIEVDWINGAFLMVKKEATYKVGLMDEDFFLYAEEAEWCYRLSKIGKLAIYGQHNVIHLQGESSNSAFNSTSTGYQSLFDKKGLQIMLSNFVRIRKQWGIFWFLVHLLIYTATIPIYFIIELITIIFTFQKPMLRLSLVSKYAVNVYRLWSYLLPIIRNKPFFYKVL